MRVLAGQLLLRYSGPGVTCVADDGMVPRLWASGLGASLRRLQDDDEPGAAGRPCRGLGAHLPPMALTKFVHDGQPEPGADFAVSGRGGTGRAARRPVPGPGAGSPAHHPPRAPSGRPPSKRPVLTVTREVAYFKAFSTTLATTWPSRSGSASQNTSPWRRCQSRSIVQPLLGGGGLEGLGRLGHHLGEVERASSAG